MIDYKDYIETMCRRCINHAECGGTGCTPKNELIHLAEFSMPMKVKVKVKPWECPCCKALNTGDAGTPYCPNCGQMLDWSEE